VAGRAAARTGRLRVKRMVDVVLATVVLVSLLPLLAVVALAIRVTSRGPVIFRQTRLGLGRRPFTVYKFRSMRVDADPDIHRRFLLHQRELEAMGRADAIEHYKVDDDDRVTAVGRVIRKLSIDELPQLVNVIRGEMSLVGPRPDMVYGLENYQPHHFRRFDVLPGITGLWQVSGRSRLSYSEMLDLDVEYAESWSLSRDLEILLRTVPVLARPDRAG
jgi:lipopolysaccharide/colanic/teichoic acid biosynthesis glycosyltransferase